MKIAEHIPLSKLTTMHVGGNARYVLYISSPEDVVEALAFVQEKSIPFYVLGKGSNTIFSDKGFDGAIILMHNRNFTVKNNIVTAGAGIFMRLLAIKALEQGLVGIEEIAGIPGTLGGAIRGNAGTWDTEIRDVLESIEVVQPTEDGTWKQVTMKPEECEFGYRHSIFKQHPDWIIVSATLRLQTGDVEKGRKKMDEDLRKRHEKQPYDAPSSGSMFKNPDKANGVFSGALIESLGLKGTIIGGAQISEKHANFIINMGTATGNDVRNLMKLMQEKVKEAHNIQLEPEVVVID